LNAAAEDARGARPNRTQIILGLPPFPEPAAGDDPARAGQTRSISRPLSEEGAAASTPAQRLNGAGGRRGRGRPRWLAEGSIRPRSLGAWARRRSPSCARPAKDLQSRVLSGELNAIIEAPGQDPRHGSWPALDAKRKMRLLAHRPARGPWRAPHRDEALPRPRPSSFEKAVEARRGRPCSTAIESLDRPRSAMIRPSNANVQPHRRGRPPPAL